MSIARTSLEDHTPATAGDPDQVTRHHPRTSKLFEGEHAYAARLVQVATAIRSVVRSTMTMRMPDEVPSETQADNEITADIGPRSRVRGSGGP